MMPEPLKQRPPMVLFLCLFMVALPLRAQDDTPRIRGTNPNYRQGDWISYGVNRFVTSVAVGTQYVYFGTTGGITRYNFYSNSWDYPFTTSNGLADNYISVVAYDQNTGFLWCGTTKGVSYYHPTAQTWNNIFKDEIGIPRYDDVVSIGIGKDIIYFETRGGRLFKGSNTGGIITPSTNGYAATLKSITWFGERANEIDSLPPFYMTDGYFFYQNYIQDFRLRRAEITAAVRDGWGYMWLGTWGFGALRGELRSEQLVLLPFGLYSKSVKTIALDEDGLWIGGANSDIVQNGLTYWDQVRHRWVYYESKFIPNLVSNYINRLVVRGDTLFCATQYGISLYDRKKDEWTKITVFDGLAKENVNDVLPDGHMLWAATDGGLNLIDLASLHTDSAKIVEIAPRDLRMVKIFDLEKTGQLLWAATEFGVYLYDTWQKKGGFVRDVNGPSGQVVTCIARYGDELWFGSWRSIEMFNLKTGEWVGAPERNALLPNPVRAIAADQKAVWAGTDGGVLKFNRKTREWRRFTVEDGLLDNQVNAILIDGDYVWFGTPQGLTVFYWNDPRRID